MTAALGVLVAHEGRELSVAEVARLAGTSKATAGRTVDRLVASGLATEHRQPRERLISINVDSPLYGPVAELLWVAQGIRRPAPLTRPEFFSHEPPFAIHDWGVQRLVPVELQTRSWGDTMLPGEVYDGPDVVRVRALVTRLRRASALIPIEPTLQETYARWHDERDRDLLHLTLHLGQGVGQAARALEAQSTPCEGSRGCVGRVGWAHAVYAVNAEAVMCLRVSTFLARAVDRARRYKRLQILVAEAQEGVRRAGERDESFQAKKTRDLGQREAELAEAAEALDGYYRHGGTPPIDSVDTAGERIIAMQCRRAAREMAARAGDG